MRLAEGLCYLMQGTDHTVEIIAAILLPVAIVMCVYALTVFIWRAKAISKKQVGPGLALYMCSLLSSHTVLKPGHVMEIFQCTEVVSDTCATVEYAELPIIIAQRHHAA